MKGKLFLIVGPSGSGKGSVIALLKKEHPEYVYPVSYTTREPRVGEKDGEVYHYISKNEFEQGIERGDFLEWAQVHKDNYYGTAKNEILEALEAGKVVVREIDIQGFKSIKEQLPKDNLVAIFLEVPDLEELKRRILGRGKLPDEEIERRMQSAQAEISEAHLCDYRIPSEHGKIEECLRNVEKIIADHSS